MIDRCLGWLETKAADYLRWCYERRLRIAWATESECPDCSMPESFCYCEERDQESDRMREVFDAGIDAGVERAYVRGDRW